MRLSELWERADAVSRDKWQHTAWLAYWHAGQKGQSPDDFNRILLMEKEAAKERLRRDQITVPVRSDVEVAKRLDQLRRMALE